MNKYQSALDTLEKFVSEDGGSCEQDKLIKAIETLQELIDRYSYDRNDCIGKILEDYDWEGK